MGAAPNNQSAARPVVWGSSLSSFGSVAQPVRRLVRAEFNIILEDLKHDGIETGALKTLLPILRRALAERTALEPACLDLEQQAAYNALQRHLQVLGATLCAQTLGVQPETAGTDTRTPAALQPTARVTHIKWREPLDEFRGTARIVANLLADDPNLVPRDICIAAPNPTWARALQRELEQLRIPVQTVLDNDVVAGDPRTRERLGTLEAYACVALAANPADPAAWRFWLALGEPDFACAAWQNLAAYAQAAECTIPQAIAQVAEGVEAGGPPPFAGAAQVASRTRTAFDHLASLAGTAGFTLRNHICSRFPSPQLSALFDLFDGDEGAPTLLTAFQARSFNPTFADRPSQVCLGSYRTVRNLVPHHLFLPGLVDGVVPGSATGCDALEQRARLQTAQNNTLAVLASKALETLTISHFQRIDAGQAPGLGLPVQRTRQYRGREVAVFSPSPFIEAAGDALPGSVSGEQFFTNI